MSQEDPRRRIEADEIVLRSKDGKHSISLLAYADGVGMWVSNGFDNVCVCSNNNSQSGPYVGVISNNGSACPVAISVNNGEAHIQLSDGGNVQILSVKELLAIRKK